MESKKMWTSSRTARKSHYGLRTAGGVLAVTVLATALAAGGVFLGFRLELPMEAVSLVLVVGVTALVLALALALGRGSVRDATVFYLTEDHRLFALDVRSLVRYTGGPIGFAAGAMHTQQLLRELAASGRIPAGAQEILQVNRLKENAHGHVILCLVRHPGGGSARRTFFLWESVPDREMLLQELERRQGWTGGPEVPENHTPFRLFCSGLALAVLAALCVLSHPAVGQLPGTLYFPCLGAAFASLICLVYFIVRQNRGE